VKPEDIFVLPTGPKWKITKSEKDTDAIYTAERTVPIGESVSGIFPSNGTKTRASPSSTWSLLSRLRRASSSIARLLLERPKPKELIEADSDVMTFVKAALPANLATAANTKALSLQVMTYFWRTMFGPAIR